MHHAPVIKTTVYKTDDAISIGSYIGRNDHIKQWEYIGTAKQTLREIERMQNAGYEFQHCIIRSLD